MSDDLHNFVIDSTDKSVHGILSTLYLISKIKEGDKINTASLELQENSWWTTFKRTFTFGEQSRKNTLIFIKKSCDDAIVIADKCLNSNKSVERELGYAILDSLDKSKTGIKEIQKTYPNDEYFISQLDSQLIILEARLKDIKNKYKTEIHVEKMKK